MTHKLSDLSELSFTSKAEVSCDYSIIRENEKETSPPDQNDSYVVIKTKPQEKCSEMSFEYMPKNQAKIPKDAIEDLSFEEDEKHGKALNSAEHDSSKQIQQDSIAKVQVDDPSVSLILAPGENPSLEINMPKNQPEDDGRREKLIASEGSDELKINRLELGSQFLKQGDFEKAAYNFERVVAQEADHVSDINMNTVFKKLATAYSKQMKFDKSLTMIQQSWIPFLEKNTQALPYDLFMAKGKALRKLCKPQAALKEFQQAYEDKSKECGSVHPKVGLVLLEIAKTQRDLGEFTQAQNSLLAALRIFKRIARMPQAILTAAYQEHSTILVELGQYQMARQILYDCVRSMKNNEDNGMDGAICYCSLGAVSFRIGDYSLAYQQYKKAKIILTGLGKGDDCLMAKVEKGIGDVFNSRNERLKAASQYSLALRIQRKFSQKDSPEIASLLCTLADIKCKLQQFQECKLCLDKAYSIYKSYDDHQSLANVYHLYGNLFAEQEQNNEAFSSYQNALTLCLKSHSANYPELAPLYKRLGKVCTFLGLISLAVEYYGKFLTIKDKELQSSNSEAIEVQGIYKALKQELHC